MIGTWCNNRISEKLNQDYPRDFSLSDIDGCIRCHYKTINGEIQTRLIIYESKNEKEKEMGGAQYKTLSILNNSIKWENFDKYSGLFIIKIVDINNRLEWYDIDKEVIRITTFDQLYRIFSCKKYEEILSLNNIPNGYEELPEVIQKQEWMDI